MSYKEYMDRNKCVIVVPIYKEEFNNDEYYSIQQLFKILPVEKYDIIAYHPQSLDLTYYYNNFKFTSYYQFWDSYFTDYPKGYNSLMLQEGFYKCFDKYEFMLVYQPDCWVFRDELEYWCNKDYDYIGAPFYLNKPDYILTNNIIGNGGFSLRKINTFIKICHNYEYFSNHIVNMNDELVGEDHIIMDILNAGIDINFKLPTFYEALHFAFEMNPNISYQVIGNKLPFGCHAYKKIQDNIFWKDFICYDKKRYSVVTFLFGDYDALKEPTFVDENAEYICITDRTDLYSNIWKFENITEYDTSNLTNWQKTMIARYTVFNHISTDQCIILDASVKIKKSLSHIIDILINSDAAFIIHPWRTSYLDEFDEWIRTRNLDPKHKSDFIEYCNKIDFDYINAKGFIMSTVMFMRKTEQMQNLCKTVLNTLMNNFDFSIRIDQLYLSVIFFKYFYDIYRTYFSMQILDSDYFDYYYHGTSNTHANEYVVDKTKPEIREVYYQNVLCKYL